MIARHRAPTRRVLLDHRSHTDAKVKAAVEAIDDDCLASRSNTPAAAQAQVAESTIEPGRRGDKLRGDDGEAARAAAHRAPQPPASAPKAELWPNWRYHCVRHRQRRPRHQSRRRLPPRPRHESSSPSETSKKAPGCSRCPSGRFFANGAWLACCRARAQPRALDRPPRTAPTPQRTAHRRGHHPQPAPHSAGHASSTTAAAARLRLPLAVAMGRPPSPTHSNESATCPNSSDQPLSAPAQRSTTPNATNPATAPQPRLNAPRHPPARTHTPARRPPRPKPSNPQAHRWIQA